MTYALILFAFIVAVIGGWLLVEVTRRRSLFLWFLIPPLLLSPVGMYYLLDMERGYATPNTNRLAEEWTLLYTSQNSDKKTIYALVQHKGETEPRFYKIVFTSEEEYEKAAKAAQGGQKKVQKGQVVQGTVQQKKNGGKDRIESEWQMYELPPTEFMQKQ